MDRLNLIGTTPSEYAQIRRDLLIFLRDCIKKITPLIHSEYAAIDESNPDVADLCTLIEMTLLLGIRIKSFYGTIPLWGLLERLEASLPLHSHSRAPLRVGVITASVAHHLRTPLARARAWIRLMLNARVMDEALEYAIVMTGDNINKFYHNYSIICCESDLSALAAILRSLRVVHFKLEYDNAELNIVPVWVALAIIPETASYDVRSRQSVSIKASPSDNSFFSMLSRDMSDLFNQATKMMATVGVSDVLAASGLPVLSAISTDDDYTAVVHRPLNLPIVPLFGSPLLQLILDERRTLTAYMEPRLGIPTQAVKILALLHEKINTVGLFRNKGNDREIHKLRGLLENEQPIPANIDIHSVAQCFLQWLYELPEPLLGFKHFDATIASAESVELDADRIRNLSIIVQDAPWYAQPLLSKVIALFAACTHRAHTEASGLNLVTVGVLVTPIFLRPPAAPTLPLINDAANFENSLLSAAVAGSVTMEYLLLHCVSIFHDMRQSLQTLQSQLTAKCANIRYWQQLMERGLIGEAEEEAQRQAHAAHHHDTETGGNAYFTKGSNFPASVEQDRLPWLASQLWRYLETVEVLGHIGNGESSTVFRDAGEGTSNPDLKVSPSTDERSRRELALTVLNSDLPSDQVLPLNVLLASTRWERCGFNPDPNPLIDFHHGGGVTAAKCLLYFLARFESRATAIISRTACVRNRFCTVPSLCTQVSRLAADSLGLIPKPSVSEHAIIQYLARQNHWKLLSDPHALLELFCLGMLVFDFTWDHLTASLQHLPSHATFEQCVVSTMNTFQRWISQAPATIEDLYSLWNADVDAMSISSSSSGAKASLSPADTSSVTVKAELVARGADRATAALQSEAIAQSHSNDLGLNNFVHSFDGREGVGDCCNVTSNSDDPAKSTTSGVQEVPVENIAASNLTKSVSGIASTVVGGSHILTQAHIRQLEATLNPELQCLNWVLTFRLTRDGANMTTLLRLAKRSPRSILVVKDSRDGIFGAVVTNPFKDEGDKYYGNGLLAVWTFSTGILQYFPAVGVNSYFMLSSPHSLGFGGGGNFAIFLDGDLYKGSSGKCATFNSPMLSREEEFTCVDLELFTLQSPFL